LYPGTRWRCLQVVAQFANMDQATVSWCVA